jgi:hypothetical protein
MLGELHLSDCLIFVPVVWLSTCESRRRSGRRCYVRAGFGSFGVRLGGVVNDDSQGVAMEGRQHGYEVLVVQPVESDWTDRVLAAVARRFSHRSAAQPTAE